MDIIRLYTDFGIDFVTEGHKHSRDGFVNVECPFCTGNPGYHLGYNLDEDYYVCWRCGWKPPLITISKLLKISEKEAYNIIKHYGAIGYKQYKRKKKNKKQKVNFSFPSGIMDLHESPNHIKYLERRKFDPEKLESLWQLKATGPISFLKDGTKKLNYKHRIIIPFIWDYGEIVSFDSRDITNKANNKYQACPISHEIIEHKHILYGNPSKWKEVGIGVEGPTDVWRFGPISCATSGIKYTNKQIRCIAKNFKRFPLVYDDDPQAITQANKLISELKFRGVESWREDIEGDPGALSQDDADHLVKQLTKKIK